MNKRGFRYCFHGAIDGRDCIPCERLSILDGRVGPFHSAGHWSREFYGWTTEGRVNTVRHQKIEVALSHRSARL